MPTFDVTTERRVFITADDEKSARAIAALFLGAADYREGYAKDHGPYRMKIFPGAVTGCTFEKTTMEKS